MTRKIRNLHVAFIVLVTAALWALSETFNRPPAHDGLWLLAVLLAVAAVGCALVITFINTPIRPNRKKQ